MNKIKWLYPGMRVKRWLILLIIGVLVVAMGSLVLLRSPLLSLYQKDIDEPYFLYLAIFSIAIGILMAAVAIRNAINSVLEVVRPIDAPKLVEHVYKVRNLEKGLRITTIGGGTGLSTMLRGLKEYSSNITSIVTVADDGGSSGRIRDDLGILPPGDIRNTLVALADTEPLMEELFQYRFDWGGGLEGHSFGNLFIAAMTDITGDFEESIRAFSKVLAVRGKVLPSTLESVRLGAIYTDGSMMLGESALPQRHKRIEKVFLEPANVSPLPEAIQAIMEADVVVVGPGSLYTSLIPNLLIPGFVDALVKTTALRIYVCNVMTQPGETDGYTAGDHLQSIFNHIGNQLIFDYIVVNGAMISAVQAKKYALEGAKLVKVDTAVLERLNLRVHKRDLLDEMDLVRHDSSKLAAEIMELASKYYKHKNDEWVI